MKAKLLIVPLVFILGCASTETTNSGLVVMSQAEYEKVVDRNTQHEQRYNGLYNVLDVTGTLVTQSVGRAQLEQNARLYQWDRAKFQAEGNKLSETQRSQTEFFLSFYTPERKNDDLQKKDTQWRVYLEVDGKRWPGKVTKIKTTLSEIQGLYPYHNRFSTPYLISFPIATGDLQGKASQFTVTGPVGAAVLKYETPISDLRVE